MNSVDAEAVIEVGVAVRDLEEATKVFVEALGAEPAEVFEVEAYQMRARMCKVGGMNFELMAPTGEGGVIDKFLQGKRGGLHHIALRVLDLERALTHLKEHGIDLIDQEPRSIDADKTRFAFVHPRSFFGVMFELIEEGGSAGDARTGGPQCP